MTLALRQSSGMSDVDNDLLKMVVNTGAISVGKSFSVRGRMASGPAALCVFSPSNSFCTPAVEIVILGICAYGLSPISGRVVVVDGLKADLNCSFSVFALSSGS